MGGGQDYVCDLLANVHQGLKIPSDAQITQTELVCGDYLYYHYGCDGFDDRGWGCGYRTLMTACSWVRGQLEGRRSNLPPVPSNHRIQEILVEIGDKERNFIGSKQWIGSVEVSHVLDTLYGVPSKILHVTQGSEFQQHFDALLHHFKIQGAPVMMGGESDVSSKGVMGACKGPTQSYLLVVDPHYWGEATEVKSLQSSEWVKWQPLSDFHQATFYNLCLPQLSATKPS